MLTILFFLVIGAANIPSIIYSVPLESANIFICYNPNHVTVDSSDCNEISSDIKTCIECTITNNQTLIFKPKTSIYILNGIVGPYLNDVSVQLYTENPLINVLTGHEFSNGIHHLRIDKIGSEYVVRQFESPSDVNYCQLNIILGFERSEEYIMII